MSSSTIGQPVTEPRGLGNSTHDRRSARKDVYLFLALSGLAVAAIQTLLIRAGGSLEEQAALVVALMWIPGLVSIGIRLARREGFSDISLRFGLRSNRTWYVLAWILPPLIGVAAYGVAWLTDIAPLDPALNETAIVAGIALTLTALVPVSAITAVGEELGWRGFLLPRLVQAGVRHPVTITNVTWFLFHVPLILAGMYASSHRPLLSALLFGVTVFSVGSVASWSRLATGTIWPAVLLHATWNSVIQGGFDAVTVGEGPTSAVNLWVGESGLLVAIASLAVALVVSTTMRRANPRAER